MTDPNYNRFPLPRAVEVVKAYIEEGADPGIFEHVVNNDLIRCMTSMDDTWLDCLHSLVLWFYTEAPASCLGRDNSRLWQARGGANGIERTRQAGKQRSLAFTYGNNVSPYQNPVTFAPRETD